MAGKKMQEVIEQASKIQNDYILTWKGEGKLVIGYTCVLPPVELMEAAGVLPYRIRALGNVNTERADSYLSRFNCSFCRSCLELALDGTYDFLDGLLETNGCDHLRGMYENWQYARKTSYFHYLKVPHVVNEDSIDFFTEEVGLFWKSLEGFTGERIDVGRLSSAVSSVRALRERLRKIYEMRAREYPAFSGYEALALLLLSSAVPSGDFVEIADDVIEERDTYRITGARARLMLCGAATDELELIKEIEGVGGIIVADNLCFGARAFAAWVDEERLSLEPERVLACNYLENILCPRMYEDFERRKDYVLKGVREANVDGVIVWHNKFCDVHGVDNVQLRLALEKEGIPVMQLEKEYGSIADAGRIKTRVQAFLERIEKRKVGV